MSGRTDAAPADSIRLAPAREADHAEIVALANAAFRGPGGWNAETGLIEGERTSLSLLRADLAADPAARLLVHRDPTDGSLLACVRLSAKDAGTWHLGLLAVRPELQARQLGRRVLAAAEQIVRDRAGARIRMGVVNLRDSLIAWYERRGYRRTGEEEDFPYGDERFGRPLRQDMTFVVLEKTL